MTARSSSGSWSGAPRSGGADIIDLDRYMRGTRPARRAEQMNARLVVDGGLAGARKTVAPALSMPSSRTQPTVPSAASSATETGSARSGGDADKRFSHDSGLSDTSYARRPLAHRPHRGRSSGAKLAPVEKVRSRASSASLRAFRAALERALRDQQEQISRVAQLCEKQAERRANRRPERGTKRGTDQRADHVERSSRADHLERSSRADHLERSSRADHLERSSRAGQLERSSRAGQLERSSRVAQLERSSRADHLDRSSRADHLDRSSRADHLDRSSRADHLDRSSRADHLERGTRADLAERATRVEQPERNTRAEHPERSAPSLSSSDSDSDLSSSSCTTEPAPRDKHRRSPDCKTYKIIMNKLDELNRMFAARRASSPPAPARPSPARSPPRPAPRVPPTRRDSSGSVTVSDKVVATDFPQTQQVQVCARGASSKRLVERGAGGESKPSAGGAAVGANTRVITCALSLDIPPINVTSAARGSSEDDGSGGGSDPSVLRGRYDLDDPVHLYAQAKRLQAMHATTRRARSADAPRSSAPGSGVTGLGSAAREVSLCALCRAYWRLARRCLTAPLGAMRGA